MRHADALDYAQVCKVFLAEGHPEPGAFDGGEILYERFQLLVIEQVAVARAYVGVVEFLVEFKRFGGHPFAVKPVAAVLCDFADVDFGVEVGCESLAVVPGIAVHNVECLHFREIMLGGIGCEHA